MSAAQPLTGWITERDRRVLELTGYGKKNALGRHPAMLVIDATYEFTGPVREPIEAAVQRVHTACGLEAWAAVDNTAGLLSAARSRSIPVFYTVMARTGVPNPYMGKNLRASEWKADIQAMGRIVDELAPQSGELIIPKMAPSAFQGTSLLYHLIRLGVDTLIFTGGTTSGCVRASVTDAFAYGFHVGVVQDCVFDRFQVSHAVSLFDMNAKCADVLLSDETIQYLGQLES